MKHFSPARKPTTILKTSWLIIILMGFILIMISSCVKDHPANSRSVTVRAGESIQAAVNAAIPGQTILIEPGTYLESILVEKQNLTLIGLKGPHNERVIIQNPGEEENGITVR